MNRCSSATKVSLVGVLTLAAAIVSPGGQLLAQTNPQTAEFLEAARKGDAEQVADLLSKDVDVEAKDENGSTALILATWDGHLEVVKVLLEHPGIDVNQVSEEQLTARDHARGRRTRELLEQAGAKKRRDL